MSTANQRSIHYLTGIRTACQAAIPAIGDAVERRRLENLCLILSRLIVDETTVPTLQAQALIEYSSLLGDQADSVNAVDRESTGTTFDAARARAQDLVRTAGVSQSASDLSLSKAMVDIEQAYFQRYEEAFRSEISALGDRAQDQGDESSTQDYQAIGTFLSGVFGVDVEVIKTDTVALGFSKITLFVDTRGADNVPETVVIRMDRPFNYLGTTVVDEYSILQVLHNNGVRVPRVYALESTGSVLGQAFIVMERVFGQNVGSAFSFPEPNPAMASRIAARLSEIHCVPVQGFHGVLKGSDQDPEQQLAAEIDKYYGDWTALNTVSPTVEIAFQWLRGHMDHARGERRFVHGDFSLSNLLIDDQEDVSAVLDWEFAKLGNPAADLGWFFYAASHLCGWEQFLKLYQAAGASIPEKKQLDFYILWGALRFAVIHYQVECGFDAGRSPDIKHAYSAACTLRETVLRLGARLQDLSAQ